MIQLNDPGLVRLAGFLKKYDVKSTVTSLGGLLTAPELQVNAGRSIKTPDRGGSLGEGSDCQVQVNDPRFRQACLWGNGYKWCREFSISEILQNRRSAL